MADGATTMTMPPADEPIVAKRGLITVCAMIATLMQALDNTIANVALPYMQGSLSTTADQIVWVLTSYVVAAAIFTAPVGWLSARFGRKNLFLICLVGFTVASMLCGLATSLTQIVVFRLLQGMFGAALVSYLAHAPFGYFERIEVTPDYQGDVEIVEREGRRLMLSHEGLQVQQPAEFAFQGAVSFLIDGHTFSTAADVASVAHANHLATFLGEETGGGYEGNNSGDSTRLTLRNSGLTVFVPQWNYTTAGVGPGHHGRGVEPDVALKPTIEAVLAGRDAVLERAQERIRAGTKR